MNENEILEDVIEIMTTKFRVSDETIKNNLDIALSGDIFKFDDIFLTYLLLEVEVKFNISIPVESIMNYEFLTINGIVQVIKKFI